MSCKVTSLYPTRTSELSHASTPRIPAVRRCVSLAPPPKTHLSVPQAAAKHTMDLWKKQRAGHYVTRDELIRFSDVSYDNAVRLYLDQPYFDEGLLPAIAAAESSIHIAMFCWDNKPLARSVVDLLIAKKRANPNLHVRVIVDDFGSNGLFPWTAERVHWRRMQAAGIDVALGSIVRDGLEHRKLILIDGKQAFVGGSCFTEEYYKPKLPNSQVPEYHDFGVGLTGSGVRALQAAFLQSWMLRGRGLETDVTDSVLVQRYFPTGPRDTTPRGKTPLKVINGIPWVDKGIESVLVEAVDAASQTLDITFPYMLIPPFVEALFRAARRGVKMRLLVPGHDGMDFKPAWYAFRAVCGDLLKAGDVEIYEFNQYTHVKLMVADHHLVFASTGNPEWNSWRRAFDETIVADDRALAADIEKRVFDVDLAPSVALRVWPEDCVAKTWGQSIKLFLGRKLFQLVFKPVEWGQRLYAVLAYYLSAHPAQLQSCAGIYSDVPSLSDPESPRLVADRRSLSPSPQ